MAKVELLELFATDERIGLVRVALPFFATGCDQDSIELSLARSCSSFLFAPALAKLPYPAAPPLG